MSYNIITYCSKTYLPCLKQSINTWLNTGAQQIFVYSDGIPKLFSNEEVVVKNIFEPTKLRSVNCFRKAIALKHHMDNYKHLNIVLLDVDCFVFGELGSVFDDNFDIAVTCTKSPVKRKINDINAGVLFVKHSHLTEEFVDDWSEKAEDFRQSQSQDQEWLNRVVKKNKHLIVHVLDQKCYNHYPHINLPQNIANWINDIEKCDEIKIIHMAFGLWKSIELVNSIMKTRGENLAEYI